MKICCKDNGVQLSDKQLELIESLGVLGENQGMSPVTARISALLMVSDKLELTFDEIKDTLGLSKSATSTSINFLLQTGKAKYITKTGDRKRYFMSNIYEWKETFMSQFSHLRLFCELLRGVKDARTPDTKEFNDSVGELASFIEFILEEIPKSLTKWETIKTK